MIALKNKKESRGLKEDSGINAIKYVHCCKVGFIPPCIMHDYFSGKYLHYITGMKFFIAPIILDVPNLSWSVSNHFGQVEIIRISE